MRYPARNHFTHLVIAAAVIAVVWVGKRMPTGNSP